MSENKKTPPHTPHPAPKNSGSGIAICTEDYSGQAARSPLVTRNFTPTPAAPAPSRPVQDNKTKTGR